MDVILYPHNEDREPPAGGPRYGEKAPTQNEERNILCGWTLFTTSTASRLNIMYAANH